MKYAISVYTNTLEGLEELEKAVETLACRLVVSQHFSFSDKLLRFPFIAHDCKVVTRYL